MAVLVLTGSFGLNGKLGFLGDRVLLGGAGLNSCDSIEYFVAGLEFVSNNIDASVPSQSP